MTSYSAVGDIKNGVPGSRPSRASQSLQSYSQRASNSTTAAETCNSTGVKQTRHRPKITSHNHAVTDRLCPDAARRAWAAPGNGQLRGTGHCGEPGGAG